MGTFHLLITSLIVQQRPEGIRSSYALPCGNQTTRCHIERQRLTCRVLRFFPCKPSAKQPHTLTVSAKSAAYANEHSRL